MDERIKKRFPSVRHTWNQWYAAKFASCDQKVADALKVLVTKLHKKDRLKAFLQDFTKNLGVIIDEHETPGSYEDAPEKIEISAAGLLGDFASFRNWKKTRHLYMDQVVPSYVAITDQEVKVVVDQGNSVIKKIEDETVIEKQDVINRVETYIKSTNENPSIYSNKTTMLIAEIINTTPDSASLKDPVKTSVENQCSISTVINFIDTMRSGVSKSDYIGTLRTALGNKKSEIPIPKEVEGEKSFVNLNLPGLAQSFMNKDHIVHNQDIAKVLVAKEDAYIEDLPTKELQADFKKAMCAVEDLRPAQMLMDPSWLEGIPFENYSQYCPIYTGLKTTPWIIRKDKNFPLCKNKETYKLLFILINKFAKFYGLWIRGNLKAKALGEYVTKALRMDPTKVYGYVVQKNLAIWVKPVTITTFKRQSALSIKEDVGMFGGEKEDFTGIFDEEYIPPNFIENIHSNLKDRDEGELDDNRPKDKRGSNNDDLRKMRNKERDKEEKGKKKNKKKGQDSDEFSINWESDEDSKKEKSSSSSGSKIKKKKKIIIDKDVLDKPKTNDTSKKVVTSKVSGKSSKEMDIKVPPKKDKPDKKDRTDNEKKPKSSTSKNKESKAQGSSDSEK